MTSYPRRFPPSPPPSNKWEIFQIPWHIQCLWNTIVYSYSGNLKPDSLVTNICIRDGCSIREMQIDPPRLIEPCGQRGYLFLTRECRLCVDCKRKLVFTMRIWTVIKKNFHFPLFVGLRYVLIREALRDLLNVFTWIILTSPSLQSFIVNCLLILSPLPSQRNSKRSLFSFL